VWLAGCHGRCGPMASCQAPAGFLTRSNKVICSTDVRSVSLHLIGEPRRRLRHRSANYLSSVTVSPCPSSSKGRHLLGRTQRGISLCSSQSDHAPRMCIAHGAAKGPHG
jgi:hypothetical protein